MKVESPVSLREWIDGALRSVDVSDEPFSLFGADPRNLALSSDEFLSSALKVARSLADQIANEVGGGGAAPGDYRAERSRGEGRRRSLPVPGGGWADFVAVHLSRSGRRDGDRDRDSAGGFGGANQPTDNGNLQSVLDSYFVDSDEEEKECVRDDTCYLSVARASFEPLLDDGCDRTEVEPTQCIYSLGLVFYELFSGGERPPVTPGSRKKFGEFSGAIDGLTAALNLADDIGNGDDKLNAFPHQVFGDDDERGAKRSLTQPSGGAALISMDPLKSKGLPGPLCDLVANMINCVNGHDESYCQMSDVIDDLQLMIDKPNHYLHDLDFECLAMNGLQLDQTIFGRNEQLAILQESYRRSINGQSECGIIIGMSGTGKSVLARRLGGYITQSGGKFLCGKFDQKQTTPFSAIAVAFNRYCDALVKEGADSTKIIAAELKRVLGEEVHYLIKVIPNLRNVLGQESVQSMEDQGCVDAQRRLRYLLCRFVDVISSSSQVPVTLFIDDVQWCDAGSIEIIHQLLLISGASKDSKRFYFLACMRQEGEASDAFCDMLSRVTLFGVRVTRVELACMDESMINTMISDLLCLSPRLTVSLSNIVYHKTKGNPFFVSRLILSLDKEGLLRLNFKRRRWEWDEEKIQSRELPDDVASFLIRTISMLSADAQMALQLLSCFGARSDFTLVQSLESKLDIKLIEPLEVAATEGLLNKVDEGYVFGHDKIQEAIYDMIPPEEQCIFHFKCGVALVPQALEVEDDGMLLFIAAGQINRAGPKAVEDADQATLIANLNLTAGHKATEMSDFCSAYSFYDNGISFLRKRHWQEHYALSLELFDSAARCAFALGDFDSLKLLSEPILTKAQSLDDKLSALYFIVNSLACASKNLEAINKGISLVSQLGEEFPDNVSESSVEIYFSKTKEMLSNVTDEQLLNRCAMMDRRKIMIMKFLALLEQSMQMIKPLSQPIATLKMVQLSLSHGMSPIAPIAFAHYGALLAGFGKNPREGYRYVKIAIALADKVGYKEFAGEVFWVGAHVSCYVEPAQAALELHLRGYDAAMASGDTRNAMVNKMFYTVGSFWSAGLLLPAVRENYTNARQLMKQYNQLTWLTVLSVLEISPLTMMGLEDEVDRSANFVGNPLMLFVHHFQNLYVTFMFRKYDQMLLSAEQYFGLSLRSGSILHTDGCQTFIKGLVAFWIYRKTKNSLWAERAQKAKQDIKHWADSSQWNFGGKLHLLEAEEHFSNGDLDSAGASYEKAITTSNEHRFLNDEALAFECTGYFFLEQGKLSTCLQYFLKAHEKYNEWGASAKSNALFEFTQKAVDLPSSSSTALEFEPADSRFQSGQTGQIKRKGMRKRVSLDLDGAQFLLK